MSLWILTWFAYGLILKSQYTPINIGGTIISASILIILQIPLLKIKPSKNKVEIETAQTETAKTEETIQITNQTITKIDTNQILDSIEPGIIEHPVNAVIEITPNEIKIEEEANQTQQNSDDEEILERIKKLSTELSNEIENTISENKQQEPEQIKETQCKQKSIQPEQQEETSTTQQVPNTEEITQETEVQIINQDSILVSEINEPAINNEEEPKKHRKHRKHKIQPETADELSKQELQELIKIAEENAKTETKPQEKQTSPAPQVTAENSEPAKGCPKSLEFYTLKPKPKQIPNECLTCSNMINCVLEN